MVKFWWLSSKELIFGEFFSGGMSMGLQLFLFLLAEFSVLALWGVMGWRCDKVLN